MKPELQQSVRHPEYSYVGVVIEIDELHQRARVKWASKRTWIAFSRLRPV
jgi:heat shock protein HspQ